MFLAWRIVNSQLKEERFFGECLAAIIEKTEEKMDDFWVGRQQSMDIYIYTEGGGGSEGKGQYLIDL